MNYEEFRKILRNGIGTRSQKEFAEQTGISREHLNRMLNNKNIPQPSKETLGKLTPHLPNTSYNELLTACGYDTVSIEDRVKEVEQDLINGFHQLSDQFWDSPLELFKTLEVLWTSLGKFRFSENEEQDDDTSDADFYTQITFAWQDEYCYFTDFLFSYAKTMKGKIVPVSISLETPSDICTDWENDTYTKKRVVSHTRVLDRKVSQLNAEERLLKAIFGGDDEIFTKVGFGFEYHADHFRDFLIQHSSSFCTSKEEVDLFQKSLNEKGDFEELFEDYIDPLTRSGGTGAVVAAIMRRETNLDFHYYWEYNDKSHVMIPSETESPKEVPHTNIIYTYAKELKLPSFGLCYHHQHISRKENLIFNTNDYFLYFNDKKRN